MVNLLDFDLDALSAHCERLGEKPFRAVQLFRWVHQRGASDFAQMSDLARSLRERPFVEAAIASGGRGRYVMWRHILPQMSPVLTVIATLQVGQLILQETALSFLGLGLPPPTATWGNILAEGRDRLLVAPWIANFAGCAIVLLVLGVNLLGNGLRETLDPRRADRR